MPLNKKGVVPNKESKRGKFINGKFHRKQTNKSAAEKRILKKKKDALYAQLMDGLIKQSEYEHKLEELKPTPKEPATQVVEEVKESMKDPRDAERHHRKKRAQKAAKAKLASKIAGFQMQGFVSEFKSDKDQKFIRDFVKELERGSNPKNKSKKFVREVPKEEDLVLIKRKIAVPKLNSHDNQKPRPAPKLPKVTQVKAKKKSKYDSWAPQLDDILDCEIPRDDKGRPIEEIKVDDDFESIFCQSGREVSTFVEHPNLIDDDEEEILTLLRTLRMSGDWRALESDFPFVLNIVVFLIQLVESRSMMAYAAATYQFATIVTNKFGSARQVVENFIKTSYALWPATTQAASQDFASVVDKFSAVMSCNLVTIFHKFIIQMVSYNLLQTDISDKLNDYFGKEKPMNMIEFISFCGSSIVTIMRIGEGLVAGVPYSELLFTDDPVSAAISRTEMILAHHDNVYTGVHVDGQISINEYLIELKTCIDTLTALSKKLSLKPKRKLELLKILPRATMSYNEKKNIMESTTRLTPYGILLVGPPGIGKSFIFIGVAKAFCEVLGIKYKTSLVYNQNAYSEYVEGYEPLSHVIWRIPELGSMSKDLAKKMGDPTTTFLTSLIDRLPITVNSAFEGKGKVRVLVNGVFIDTNSTDLNFDVLVKNPAAYERRFAIIEVRVMDEYVRDGYRLDEQKSIDAGGDPMDRWYFRFVVKTPCESNPNTKSVEKVLVEWCRWSEFKEFFQAHVRAHFDKERAVQAQEAALIAQAGRYPTWSRNVLKDIKMRATDFIGYVTLFYWYFHAYCDFCFHFGTNSFALIMLHLIAAVLHIVNPILPSWPRSALRAFLRHAITPAIDSFETRFWFAGDVIADTKLPLIAAGFITFAFLIKVYSRKRANPDEEAVCKYVKRVYSVDVSYDEAIRILANYTLRTETQHKYVAEARRKTGIKDSQDAVNSALDSNIAMETKVETTDNMIVIDSVRDKYGIKEDISFAEAINIIKSDKVTAQATNFQLPSSENDRLIQYENAFECRDSPRKIRVGTSDLWNTIYELPNPKCLNDPEQIHKSVMANIRKIRIHINGTNFNTHILGIFGNHAVINEHALQGQDRLVMALIISDTQQSSFTFERRNARLIAPDVLLFRVKYCNFRDIRDYFLKESFPTLSCNGSVGNMATRVHFISGPMSMHEPFGGKDIILPRYLHYSVNHYSGMCGTPIFAKVTAGYHITGIHCAASDVGERAYGAPMIGCDFSDIEDGSLPIASEGAIVTQATVDPVSKSPFRHEHFGAIKYLGKLPGATMINSDSELVTTLNYKEIPALLDTQMRDDEGWFFGPPHMKPAVINGVWHSPYNNALRKMNRGQIALNPDAMKRVKKILFDRLAPLFVDLRPTSIEAAVNGIQQDNISRRINVKTSAGVGLPGKKLNYLPIVEEGEFLIREPIEEIKFRINEKIKFLSRGITTETIFKASPKDEAREREKNKMAKTRLFYGVQLDSLILQRMFLFPFFSKMIERMDLFCTGIGINMHQDADEMIVNMLKFSPHFMEGDYEGFEFNVPFMIAELAMTLIYELLAKAGYPPFALRVLSSILTEMLHPVICIMLDIVQVPGMQPSGCYATAELNSFKQLLILVYVYVNITDRDDFFDMVLPKTYGDDLLATVKPEILSLYNNITFSNFCGNYMGLNFTPSSKSGEHKLCLEVEETSFLKRFFRYHKVLQKWVAPLNKVSICKALMLAIPSKAISFERQQIETMTSMLYEIFLWHDEVEKFESLRGNFIALGVKLGYTYEELDNVFPTSSQMMLHFGGQN